MSLFKYSFAKRKREESCEGNDEEVDAPANVSPAAKTEDTTSQERMCCEIRCAAVCGVVLVAQCSVGHSSTYRSQNSTLVNPMGLEWLHRTNSVR